MSNVYIYLAGPVTGCADKEANDWREEASDRLGSLPENTLWDHGFRGVSPLRCEPPGDDGKYAVYYNWKLANEITAKNWLDVERCDCVLAYFPPGERVSVGTILEIGWAIGMRKTVIVVSSDKRITDHPLIMSKVPFIYEDNDAGWDCAYKTIEGLFGVYS